jgi:hypothetical protein
VLFRTFAGAALFRGNADHGAVLSPALGGSQRTVETDSTRAGFQMGQGTIDDPFHKRRAAYAVEGPPLRATAPLVQWQAWYTNI